MHIDVQVLRLPNFPEGFGLPEYETEGAAAFDIRAADGVFIEYGETYAVPTGLAFAVPDGYEMQIRSRSGLSKRGLVVTNAPGTIDSDYRGEVKVLLTNINSSSEWPGPYGIFIEKGDRIAQGLVMPVYRVNWQEVEQLPATARGTRGFGSTGL